MGFENAITLWKKARDIAEKEDNKTQKWSYSNLGDFLVTLANSRII
jgi:hypothetical protein